ncbi:uncharacterized protein LOC132799964 [Ziziphus jujuba]|uniref:Uncharacterized protein LOC132799964 n=1 Tax=Ziziphus jujuba TaxID=326968 RepID=A0ABM3ZW04_ZIZJJ|nr:uncharacterized protein LOC132799964 [Ziziphus jujuba]
MDFIFKLPPTVQRHDGIWVIVDRLTKFAHFLPIREKFSPQKLAELFMNHIVKDLKFEISDRVFLRLSPWKGVVRFGKRGKLSPCYIGLYEIVERIDPVAYKIDLPEELSRIHDVFHMSMLHKYISDPSHMLETSEIEFRDDLSYEEQPVQILGREEKRLRNKTIALVKVLWRNQIVKEATWE